MVVKFKPIFHGKSKFTHKKQKVYQIMMGVVNWEQNGYKITEIEKNIKKMLKQQLKDDVNDYEFNLNGLFYYINGKGNFKRIGWFMKKGYVDIDNLHFFEIDSVEVAYVKQFIIQITKTTNMFGLAGEDKHNDCVFNCLLTAFNGDKTAMHKSIWSPSKFKTHFGYGRDDKVDLLKIIESVI